MKRGRLVPVGLLLVAFALRLFRLGDQNVWWDEGLAIWAVRKPWLETTLWTAADVHPPLFFWTLWPWVRLVGQGEFAARYITVAWAMLSVVLCYVLGRRLGGGPVGVLALALLAVSRFEIWWSMEMRMYMLAGTAVLAAAYALVRWLDEGAAAGPGREAGGRRWLPAHLLAALAAMYTVYLSAVAVVIFNLVVLTGALSRRVSPRRLSVWLGAQIALVVLFLPWLTLALPRMQSWTSIREPVPAGFVTRLWATLLATGVSTDLDEVRWATAVFWLAALVGFAMLFTRFARGASRTVSSEDGWDSPAPIRFLSAGLLGLFLLLPPLAVWAATQPRSFFYSPQVEARYLLPFAAPVYVLVAWAVVTAFRRLRPLGVLLGVGVVLPLLVHLPGYYTPRRLTGDLYAMSLAIWSQAEPGDVVLLVSGNRYPLFRYYYDQPWVRAVGGSSYEYPWDRPPRWAERPEVIEFPDRGTDSIDAHDWQAQLGEIVDSHERVWLVEYGRDLQDPQRRVEAWLTERLPRVLSEGYGPDALHLYSKDGQPPRLTRVSSRFPGTVWWPEDYWCCAAYLAVHPVVQPPARRALPGDALETVVFTHGDSSARARLQARPHQRVVAPRPSSTEAAVPEEPAWPDWPLWRGDGSGKRVRLTVPVSGRTPGGFQWIAGDVGGIGFEFPVEIASTPPLVPEVVETDVRTAGAIRLAAYAVAPREAAPGEVVVVDLYWLVKRDREVPEPPPVVFAHLIGPPRDASGDSLWAGQDGPPSSGGWDVVVKPDLPWVRVFDRHVLEVDVVAPEGTYQIEVGLYDPDTGERLPVSGGAADPAERRILLGEVEVR